MKPKEIRAFKFEINKLDRDSDEVGIFEGYASAFNTFIPGYNERVSPGAFAKTLSESGGKVPILWNHNSDNWIGIGRTAIEDKKGLKVTGRLAVSTAEGYRAYALLQMARDEEVPAGLSIGFRSVKDSQIDEGKKKIRLLEEVQLLEYSITAFPANPKAFVTDVRSEEDLTIEEIRAWLEKHPEIKSSDIPELDTALRQEPPQGRKPDYHLLSEELAKIRRSIN